jgi:hypothetical protein
MRSIVAGMLALVAVGGLSLGQARAESIPCQTSKCNVATVRTGRTVVHHHGRWVHHWRGHRGCRGHNRVFHGNHFRVHRR